MQNHQKIATAVIKNFSCGQNVSHGEIVEKVLDFSTIEKGSILPADYCINNIGKDPRVGKYSIFWKVKRARGRYIVLPHEIIKESCGLK